MASRTSPRGTTRPNGAVASASAIMPGTWRSDPFSPSSPQKAKPSVQPGRQLTRGDEQADGDRQVEPRSPFAHARRREVHGHPTHGPGQAAGQHSGADTVSRLAYRGVGQADDREAGQSVGDVDLDRHRAPDGAAQRGGGDRGEHSGERSHRARTRETQSSCRDGPLTLPRENVAASYDTEMRQVIGADLSIMDDFARMTFLARTGQVLTLGCEPG